jgi:uncharacterized protein (TIGR00290 family)
VVALKTALSWSSGKDSAWTLHVLHEQGIEVSCLLTTVNEAFARVAMHGVRRELLEAQAEAAGIPLLAIDLPWPCSNDVYEERMRAATERLISEGFTQIAFGDLFLGDIRSYREKQLDGLPLQPIFPLWNIPTDLLANRMLDGGIKACITTVDPRKLPASIAGRTWDRDLIAEFPAGIDPCGENGEFHTFVYDGPMFSHPIDIKVGEIVERDGFVFADVVPQSQRYENKLVNSPGWNEMEPREIMQ